MPENEETTFNISTIKSIQPGRNFSRNCTISVHNQHSLSDNWFAVACNRTFKAHYICQSRNRADSTRLSNKLNDSQTECDRGWIIGDSFKTCYMVLIPRTILSFYDAHTFCVSMNSKLLSINSTHIGQLPDVDYKIIFLFWNSYLLHTENITHEKSLPANTFQDYFLFHYLFGFSTAPISKHNNIYGILFRLFHTAKLRIVFWAKTNQACSIYQFSFVKYIYIVENPAFIRGWGIKYRRCSDLIKTTAVVCIKDTKRYAQHCKITQFECEDQTCILKQYICDSVNDCFEGSDEIDCSENFITSNNTLHIPFSMSYNCTGFESCEQEITVHSVCDGIYSESILPDEQEVCNAESTKYIHLWSLLENNPKVISHSSNYGDLYELYLEERKMTPDYPDYPNTSHLPHIRSNFDVFEIERCTGYSTRLPGVLEDMCKIGVQYNYCNSSLMYLICPLVGCPGWFRCNFSYCMDISSVCDGQIDCINGEDENSCSSYIVQGYLNVELRNTV